MDDTKKLEIVLREMMAYANRYRCDWSDFDGRQQLHQFTRLEKWASNPNQTIDFTEGTEFLKDMEKKHGY